MTTRINSLDLTSHAELTDALDGVRVALFRSARSSRWTASKLVGEMTIDAPFHVALDKVHDLLREISL